MISITPSGFFETATASRTVAAPSRPATARLERSQEASDGHLVGAIARGDRRALEALYVRHNVRVYRFVLRLLGNTALAEDIVSEVFLEVWRHAGRFEAKSQVTTWLLAIARNKALSGLRRRTDEPLDEHATAAIADTADDPEVMTQKKDRSAALQACLSRLSAEHREVIDLVYYHERSVEEVAQIVGVPVNTVKTRTFYARRRMAELLKAEGFGEL